MDEETEIRNEGQGWERNLTVSDRWTDGRTGGWVGGWAGRQAGRETDRHMVCV